MANSVNNPQITPQPDPTSVSGQITTPKPAPHLAIRAESPLSYPPPLPPAIVGTLVRLRRRAALLPPAAIPRSERNGDAASDDGRMRFCYDFRRKSASPAADKNSGSRNTAVTDSVKGEPAAKNSKPPN